MKLNNTLPLLIFIILVGLLALKSLNKDSYNIKHDLNFTIDLSKLKSMNSNQAIKLPESKYLLHIFSSWCRSCKSEYADLFALQKKYNLKIIGLVWKDSVENINKMLIKYGNPYQDIAFADNEVILNLGISGVPETFVVDENGKVLLKLTGAMTREIFENAIYPKLK